MNDERIVESRDGGGCVAFADELTRVACDELLLEHGSAGLQAHVRGCATCAETLRDAALLLPSLEAALRPTPLSAALIERVGTAIAARPVVVRRLRVATWRAPLAAAAAIGLLFFWHGGASRPDSAGSDARDVAVRLSAEDAAAIAAAFGLVQWGDVAELAVASAETHLDTLEQALERRDEPQTLLQWSADDDWDLPPAAAGSWLSPPGGVGDLALADAFEIGLPIRSRL